MAQRGAMPVAPAEFVFPVGATAPVAARVGRAIWAADSWPALLPYAAALEAYVTDRSAGEHKGLRLVRPPRTRPLPWQRWLATFRYPRWSGDVVIVGECARTAEIELMARLIDALLRSGRTLLYLSVYGREHAALRRLHRDNGWSSACTLARLARGGFQRQFWMHANAPQQLWRDWAPLQPLLAAADAVVHRDAADALRDIALARLQWGILKTRLRFHTALTRTKYQPLSAALLADCLTTPRLSVSLQHSIITCPGSFSPLLAKRYLCFGPPSRALLSRLEDERPRAPQSAGGRSDLLVAGAFTDPLPPAPARREPATVVLVDQTSTWAARYFGGGGEAQDALPQLAQQLAHLPAVRRIVVRLHPTGDSQGVWDAMAAQWPGRVIVRAGDRPLAEDLVGASAVIGLFSTVLPSAAAAGVPTFFLWRPGWFSTPDLAPFAPNQFVEPTALLGRLEGLLGDPAVFARESATARAAAAHYYAGWCAFDPPLVEAMLAPLRGAASGVTAYA